jgi:selenocysteine lyase/cysteine desulfurase
MTLSRRDMLKTVGAGLLVGPRTGLDTFGSAAESTLGSSTGSGLVSSAPGAAAPDFAAVRRDFPRAERKLWLAAAESHPFSVHAIRIMEEYSQQRALSTGGRQHDFGADAQAETKQLFGDLINATPNEVAFALSTTDGENVVVAGMDLASRGGNVVLDDLHFTASRYLYEALERDFGVEVRLVRHKDWTIDPADMARAIDDNTRLVSVALTNNINGFLHDMRPISDAAHAHGAYVYADIIQTAGCTPIDVKAMGIDAAACTAYKWLMGDFGFAFLYVREDLQGTVIRPTRYGLRQVRQTPQGFEPREGAAMYEGTSSLSSVGGLVAREGLRYVTELGVDNIRAHAKRLTDRLHKEMPALGFPALTRKDNPTPIVSFHTPDQEAVDAKLQRAFGEKVVSSRRWQITEGGETKTVAGLRIGVSVYNNDDDLDAFLNALS